MKEDILTIIWTLAKNTIIRVNRAAMSPKSRCLPSLIKCSDACDSRIMVGKAKRKLGMLFGVQYFKKPLFHLSVCMYVNNDGIVELHQGLDSFVIQNSEYGR
ncbi:hypothetical protein WICPIJ_005764 [Wickerhamomyces pijperi]|uniref:Uncharacterized protein n=1 Tax=Wickerhamomyces pijperi TaxID=599730 RepID=A0A9P8Q5Q9_WICPI|nr:hypothetical protein WICPIJ_005764 [Wickerhamomyces pijperi]